jgi:signal transduction histidine kinase
MRYDWVIPLAAAVLSLILGVISLRNAAGNRTNRVFAFMAATLVSWNLNFFALYFIEDHDLVFSVTRWFRAGAIFLPVAVLHLFTTLADRRSRFWNGVLAVDYGIALMLVCANALDLVVSDVHLSPWGYTSVGSKWYDVFTALVIVNFAVAFALLAYEYSKCQNPRTRLQLKFWLLGGVIAIPLGMTTFFPVYGIPIYPLGNLGNVAWAGVVAYAIVRHRLMDIQVVVTKGMAYAAVSALLIVPIFALSLGLQRFSYGSIHPDFSSALLAMFIAVAILFPMLRERIEPRIERSWLGRQREYRILLLGFARHLVRILERERLVRELATALQKTLRLDRVAIALLDEDDASFRVVCSLGVEPPVDSFAPSHPLIRHLQGRRYSMSRDEMLARGDTDDVAVIATALEPNGWEVCIPLAGGGQLLGFIALGPKPNVEAFFVEDFELLETLAAEAAIALENARLYEELKRSQDIIRRADRSSALGTLAAGIAHEIRNPLVSIQTFFQLAPQRLHDEEFMTEFLDMTANEVRRISHLINELLSFARSPTPSYGAVDLKQLVERAVILIAPEAKKHRIDLRSECTPDTPLVYGDAEQIRQVLVNLAFNAFQATVAGGWVEIQTRAVRRQGAVFGRVEVRDTGCGIPSEHLEQVFNPFFTTKVKGTGLGLAIVQRIISEHGGVVSVESQEGIGSAFMIDLPTTAANWVAEPSDRSGDQLFAPPRLRRVAS